MQKSLLIIVYWVLGCWRLEAQQPAGKDSLLRALKTAREDSNKVILLLGLGEQFENQDPETAKQYYRQSLQLSQKIGYKTGEIKFASYYTAVLNMQGSYDSSLLLNKQALELARQQHDELAIVKTTLNTANVYALLQKNDSAVHYYMQALPVLDKSGNKRMLGIAYNNLQSIYLDLLQYDKGIEYGKKALAIFRNDVNDTTSLSYGLVNLGNLYSTIGNYEAAGNHYKEALQLSRQTGDRYTESTILLDLGDINYQTGQYAESKPKFEQALAIANEMGLSETKTIALKGLAMYNLQTKNYQAARQLADTALDLALNNNLRKQALKIYKLLSDISYASQDLTAAKEFAIKEDRLNDSINKDNVQRISTEFETKYETEKKEVQIKLQAEQLKQQSALNYLLIGGAAALLVILLLSFRNYKNRQKLQQAKIDELETERQLSATEAVLRGEEQERTRLAKDLHDGLGGMLSGIKYSLGNMKEHLIMTPDNAQAFERSIDMLDSSIKEMRRVAHNMMPEMLLKYGLDIALKEFCAEISRSAVINATYQSIDMDKAVFEQTTAVTVYRIVQELVNNTIKHAGAKNVLVQAHIAVQEKLLAVTVEDDGKGFDTAILKSSPGIGWSNIANRIEFLHGRFDISAEPGKGTSVLIEINT